MSKKMKRGITIALIGVSVFTVGTLINGSRLIFNVEKDENMEKDKFVKDFNFEDILYASDIDYIDGKLRCVKSVYELSKNMRVEDGKVIINDTEVLGIATKIDGKWYGETAGVSGFHRLENGNIITSNYDVKTDGPKESVIGKVKAKDITVLVDENGTSTEVKGSKLKFSDNYLDRRDEYDEYSDISKLYSVDDKLLEEINKEATKNANEEFQITNNLVQVYNSNYKNKSFVVGNSNMEKEGLGILDLENGKYYLSDVIEKSGKDKGEINTLSKSIKINDKFFFIFSNGDIVEAEIKNDKLEILNKIKIDDNLKFIYADEGYIYFSSYDSLVSVNIKDLSLSVIFKDDRIWNKGTSLEVSSLKRQDNGYIIFDNPKKKDNKSIGKLVDGKLKVVATNIELKDYINFWYSNNHILVDDINQTGPKKLKVYKVE